jgi:glycosyltransferase involved in cell wall biosynthesis
MTTAPAPRRPLRVTMVDHSADPGGGQLGLLRYLEDTRDLDVSLILLTGGPLVDAYRATGHKVTVLDEAGAFSFARAPLFSRRFSSAVREHSPDVIVANSLYATITMAFARVAPRITRVYYSRVSMETLKGLKRVLAIHFFFRQFDGFLANSKWTKSCIPTVLARRPIRVAYPISGVTERTASTRSRPSGRGDELVIASLSRPDRWKGTDILIDAVKAMTPRPGARPVRLDIYGGTFFSDPAFITEIEDSARESAVPIRFLGHVDDVASVLDEVDIVVLSTRFPEPFGQVVVQGLAHGAVVVVPDQGGPMEVVEDGVNGLVFHSGDPDSLRTVLEAAIGDADRMTDLVSQGRRVVEDFGDDQMRRMLEQGIREIVESAPRGRRSKAGRDR